MTVAQSWALIGLIGVFATAVVTLIGFLLTGVRGEITGLRGEIQSLRADMHARFEHMDRDLQAVINRVFRRDEG